MTLYLLNDPLFRAVAWLEKNARARMTSEAKLAHLLVTFGGSYKPSDPETLRIAGVHVSCTGGTGNLLSAWRRKAESKLNAATAKAGAS